MDTPQYSTLLKALQGVPDPRQARGKRYPWLLLLTILVSGMASGYQTARAIGQWAHLHADALQAALPHVRRIPSESTLLRTLRQIDVTLLEAHIAQFRASLSWEEASTSTVLSSHGEVLTGQALDGKTVRGATTHGKRTHLVSLVQHGSGATLAQTAVLDKQQELSASQTLLMECDLTGSVITMDALLAQRALAQQIRDQGGHYLMVVKDNHPQMRAEIALFFDIPSIPADEERCDRHQTLTKAHGRLESRTLECTTGIYDVWAWPDAAQVLRRTCDRLVLKTGKRSVEVTYGITSLSPDDAGAAELERLWRGHWTIENRKHYVRDVTLGEDRNQMHTGNAPQVLAALRNGLIDLWRAQGWRYIADAVRECAASVERTLTLLGALPAMTLT